MSNKGIYCPHCHRDFSRQYKTYRAGGGVNRSHRCLGCGKKFKTAETVVKRPRPEPASTKTETQRKRRIKCTTCFKQRIVRAVHPTSGKSFCSESCLKAFLDAE